MHTNLRSVDKLELIILVDNSIDWTSASQHENIQSPRQWVKDKESALYLVAGHGFSVLLKATIGKDVRTVMYDAGPQELILSQNAEILGIQMDEIEGIVMSHGHWDHFGGLEFALNSIGKQGLPVYVHPRMFLPKAYLKEGNDESKKVILPEVTSEVKILEAGGRIISERSASTILDDTFLISGEIPRETDWEKGMKGALAFSQNGWQDDHEIIDDRCLVVNVRNKGLVVLSGCSHAGIVNMVKHCIRLTSESKIAAIIGGFHLGNSSEDVIDATTESGDGGIGERMLNCLCCCAESPICSDLNQIPSQVETLRNEVIADVMIRVSAATGTLPTLNCDNT